MQLSSLVASSLLLAGSVLAQDTSQVQAVKVSNKNGDLVFTPNNIKAAVDTYVQFQYYAKNHSVAQSDFAHPCMPIAQTMPGAAGFFSGFMPTTNDAPQRPVFTIKIKDTKPIWFYCSQAKHCQTGMVGAINA